MRPVGEVHILPAMPGPDRPSAAANIPSSVSRPAAPTTASDVPTAAAGRRIPTASATEWVAIALGGAIGACLRFAVTAGLEQTGLDSVWGTATANLLGALGLGLLSGLLTSRHAHPLWRPFLAVGLMGSFTTFSTLLLDHRALAAGTPGLAVIQLTGTLLVGLLAFHRAEAWVRSRPTRVGP